MGRQPKTRWLTEKRLPVEALAHLLQTPIILFFSPVRQDMLACCRRACHTACSILCLWLARKTVAAPAKGGTSDSRICVSRPFLFPHTVPLLFLYLLCH